MLRNPFRDLDQKKLSRSSDVLKKQNDYFKIVNRRIIILSSIIVLLFAAVSVRLFFLQIRDNDEYTTKLENYSSQKQRDMTPRGQIYDRNGKLVVKTVAAHNIVYFPPKDATAVEKWELAQKFVDKFSIETDKMTDSDYQDLYLFLHVDENGKKDNGYHLLSEEELTSIEKESEKEKLIRSRITRDMANELADEKTKQAYVVYQRMNKLPSNQTKTILEDVNDDDAAYMMVHKDEYRGFSVDLNSWKREYPYGSTLLDVLGNVTTSQQGVPSELSDYYQALGYSLTDRVGKSGLEKQYESLLSGTPKISSISYDENNLAVLTETTSGKKGYDLHLTIDIELQEKVDKVLADIVKEKGGTTMRENFSQAFVLLMNPQTGEVYSMSGASKQSDGEVINFSSGVYLTSYEVGSVVKGATVYMALNEGVQTKSSIENDEPMVIAGTPEMKSYKNYGAVNAIDALAKSSNVYMFKSIIKLGGGVYQYGQPLNFADIDATIANMRQYYSMFGLGSKTGLDIPNEALGVTGFAKEVGSLLYFGIGQYDTYTPMQLGVYVSTIANSGKKIQPKLVNSATEVNSDYTVFENKTKVLATLNGNQENIDTVREGFRKCVTSGFCGLNSGNQGNKYDVAAKTGTAEHANQNQSMTNASLIGFAPYDGEAEVAFVCSAPESSTNTTNLASNVCAYDIMPAVLDVFEENKNNK